jgi:acetoin utilization deacetylase AcuC-like enzyme
MQLFYTDHFELPLPVGHRFPMAKYRRLRDRIVATESHRRDVLVVPPQATLEQLQLAHAWPYIHRVLTGQLSPAEQRRIGFPWTAPMVERSRRSVGASLAACRQALRDRLAVNLAGGTHHAMWDAGEGYCVFNDAAVALRTLLVEGSIDRAAVIDCDVHQGNGTAQILADDPRIFTFSIHCKNNFPLRKYPSDLDIDLAIGTDDHTYLAALRTGLDQLFQAGPFPLVMYLAGADPFEGDRLGRLKLTKSGLLARDRLVLERSLDHGAAVAIAMAGGYAPSVDDIVDIHAATVQLASALSHSG